MSGVNTVKELLGPEEWCKQSIGIRFRDWYSYNLSSNDSATDKSRVFAFKDEATLLVFKLTWGQYGIR